MNPATPSAFHSEFGNFDQFLNTLGGQSSWHNHGASEQMTCSVHTAHDIMLQDTEGEHHGQLVLSSMPQTGMQTLKIAQEELPDC